MKNNFLIMICLLVTIGVFAQKDEVLLTINNQPVYTSEFKRVYEKNLEQINEEEKDIDKNLDLFVNYKLKIQEAYHLKLDTAETYKKELRSYKSQLMAPYLQDQEFKEKQLKEAYARTKEEIRASHILIRGKSKTNVERDSTTSIAKLEDIRARVKNGESFEKLAKEFSEDPSVKVNGGDLGYFSAFRMVHQFEDAAYNTKVGEVSKPFSTRFGYHILYVADKRPSKGEFEAAHILVRGKDTGKQKIDSLYNEIVTGASSFEDIAKEASDDKPSAKNGGKLPKFGTGRMVQPFENAVLSLEEGEMSKPFATRFGWHIVKLIKKHPIQPFETIKKDLQNKIRASNRGNLATEKLLEDLKKEYQPTIDTALLNEVKVDRDKEFPATELGKVLLTVKGTTSSLGDFMEFIKNKKYLSVDELWHKFYDEEVLSYYKDDLENIYPEYKYTLQEYKDGLLLFDLMKMKIWDKAQNDQDAMKEYFEKNQSKYNTTDITSVKGEVINDYQNYLESEWITSLKSKNEIKIKKKVLKKLKKAYNQ